jgi:hypothetical protein
MKRAIGSQTPASEFRFAQIFWRFLALTPIFISALSCYPELHAFFLTKPGLFKQYQIIHIDPSSFYRPAPFLLLARDALFLVPSADISGPLFPYSLPPFHSLLTPKGTTKILFVRH